MARHIWRELNTRFGRMAALRLAFYPLTVLLTTPFQLATTLVRSRVLLDGRWGSYNAFTPFFGISTLFYYTMAINLYRHGRRGTAPHLGMGNYPLSRWFFQTLVSLYAYWRLAPIGPPLGMFGWLAAHAVFAVNHDFALVLAVMGLALISTGFYFEAFIGQNYNTLGWAFVPLGLYAVTQGIWPLAVIAWLGVSLGSFTATTMMIILCFAQSLWTWSPWPLLTVLPALCKLLTHFLPNLERGDVFSSSHAILMSIGILRRPARYKHSSRLGLSFWFYLASFGQFVVVAGLLGHPWLGLILAGFILFVLNSTGFRFADPCSLLALMMSLATGALIVRPDPLLAVSTWLVISPLPAVLLTFMPRPRLDTMPALAPFRVENLVRPVEDFLALVRPGERVLMAFEDPVDDYSKIFDGYRVLLELPLYVAGQRDFHFLPDWWAVISENHPQGANFWGRSLERVSHNVRELGARYAVVYQNSGTALDPAWQAAGFQPLRRLDWADYYELDAARPYLGETPCWWLLRSPD
ncbi:MAG: hypothetical protein AMXMBFR33_65560 [Candidatus Xenobia bacterium]